MKFPTWFYLKSRYEVNLSYFLLFFSECKGQECFGTTKRLIFIHVGENTGNDCSVFEAQENQDLTIIMSRALDCTSNVICSLRDRLKPCHLYNSYVEHTFKSRFSTMKCTLKLLHRLKEISYQSIMI